MCASLVVLILFLLFYFLPIIGLVTLNSVRGRGNREDEVALERFRL
jgi:hypothetical protein